MFDHLLRKHFRSLIPYSSARDEYFGQANIFLDANENPFEFPYHRYPDPYQRKLKSEIAKFKNINANHLFLGNGSDEIIDLLIRGFCEPGIDSILAISPSYGMYKVSAEVNNVNLRLFYLNQDYSLDAQSLIDKIQPNDKMVFICSPNNPTGNCFAVDKIKGIALNFPGLVIIDEAYIDFSDQISAAILLSELNNVVVLQTFSKALASAGLRLGVGIMHFDLVQILNKIKPPYNISQANQEEAMKMLARKAELKESIQVIKSERAMISELLRKYSFVEKVFPSQANFILVKVTNALNLYNYLMASSIIVRNRSGLKLCEGCLRITIGTPEENRSLIKVLNKYE